VGITLCGESDIKARLQLAADDDLSDRQQAAWPGLAEEATVQVEGFLKREWVVDPNHTDINGNPDRDTVDKVLALVPKAVRVVVSRMVVRAMTQGTGGVGTGSVPMDGQQSQSSTFGPMSYSRGFSTDVFSSPWLSRGDKLALLRYVGSTVYNVPMFDDSYKRHPHTRPIRSRWWWNDW
jgi:hypothetical protein